MSPDLVLPSVKDIKHTTLKLAKSSKLAKIKRPNTTNPIHPLACCGTSAFIHEKWKIINELWQDNRFFYQFSTDFSQYSVIILPPFFVSKPIPNFPVIFLPIFTHFLYQFENLYYSRSTQQTYPTYKISGATSISDVVHLHILTDSFTNLTNTEFLFTFYLHLWIIIQSLHN